MIKRLTLKVQAYNYLKNEILEGRIASGAIYSEQKFADDLSISRTPVRDAILQLAHEGFVKIHPNKGISVKELTPEDVKQIFQVRSAIESYCAMYAAEHINTDEGYELIKNLESHLKAEKDIIDTGSDFRRFMSEDTAFHMCITSFCKNEQIIDIMLNLRGKIDRVGAISLSQKNRLPNTLREHTKIVDAIKSGDASKVYAAITYHFKCCQDIFVK
ncbi:MAG: GntR family transcriptional regulator [Clostridia bacterium]|nr:GntR family transcriptional regulator [Clostridia bacterium]MCI1999377.1 GntR family transcriptional regulator [Clostridia bacterium]MCI2015121.1 GntR family transcriptional regulator [Clostridia bacterium]